MKKLEMHEKCEIADLIQEILEKDHYLNLETLIRFNQRDQIEVSAGGQGIVGKMSRNGLLSGLRFIVDEIRKEREEPSRQLDFENFLVEDAKHAAAGIGHFGPRACCSNCGDASPLNIKVKVDAWVSWKTGLISFHGDEGVLPAPGEIGACQGCGKHYTFLAT